MDPCRDAGGRRLMPEERPPVLSLLYAMTDESIKRSGLDQHTFVLVRIAALVAMDASPLSYLTDTEGVGITREEVQDVLLAVAPLVGSVRILTAADNLNQALDLALDLGKAEDWDS
jgi:alkylhydroperoxidase/carboxymuconolactone decarboxylase family protein YurZ